MNWLLVFAILACWVAIYAFGMMFEAREELARYKADDERVAKEMLRQAKQAIDALAARKAAERHRF